MVVHFSGASQKGPCCKGSVVILLLLVLLDLSFLEAACPEAADISPCTCDDEGFQCLKLNNSGLAKVFRAPAERKAIRRVWILQTELTELPAHAFGDYIFRDLYLDMNHISKVASQAFGQSSRTLQSLSLTRNELENFPFDDLRQMKKLRQLGFGYNRLKSISSGAFPPSELLESLDLSHNQIESLESGAFGDLFEVSLIDLSRNNLRIIESNALTVRSSQRHLAISLRANQIDTIAVDAFGMHHPYSLDLSRNQLTYLERLVFEPLLLNDTTIYVEGNPFSCSECQLYKWLLDLDHEAKSNLVSFACVDGTKLDSLTYEMIGCTGNDS